jgi:hypothetical protein
MIPGDAVVTNYCIGRVFSYDSNTKIVRVLHRLSEHHWVVKSHHVESVSEYRGFMWEVSDALGINARS